MLTIERLNNIKALLEKNGSINTKELSILFKVSEETIRRDLKKLSSEINFKIVRGGAFLHETPNAQIPIDYREKMYIQEKSKIAIGCLKEIKDNEIIGLDNSSTALHIARLLNKSNKKLTVVTNSQRIISALIENMNIKIICLGGELRKNTRSYVGYQTTEALERLFLDKSFVSCSSINLDYGITENNSLEAKVKEIMLNNSFKKFLVVDHTKFAAPSGNKICTIKGIDKIITDSNVSKDIIKQLGALKIKVEICS